MKDTVEYENSGSDGENFGDLPVEEGHIDAEPVFKLTVNGAIFVRELIDFCAQKGGFPISAYGDVFNFSTELDEFVRKNTNSEVDATQQ